MFVLSILILSKMKQHKITLVELRWDISSDESSSEISIYSISFGSQLTRQTSSPENSGLVDARCTHTHVRRHTHNWKKTIFKQISQSRVWLIYMYCIPRWVVEKIMLTHEIVWHLENLIKLGFALIISYQVVVNSKTWFLHFI